MARQNYHTATNRPGSPAVQHETARRILLYPRSKAFSSNSLENSVMRLHLQIRPSIARTAAVGTLAFLFTSGMTLSAFGQAAQPLQTRQASVTKAPLGAQDPQASSVVNGTPLSMDEAVRMALENNLGIQAERVNPEIQNYAVARANAVWRPALVSQFTRSSSSAPPQDFLAQGVNVVTNGTLFSQAGLQQALRWGGASYQFTFDGSRGTTNNPGSALPRSLGSNMSGLFTQPLLRNFRIDNNRANLLQQRNLQTVADLQLQQRITQTSLAVRTAYYNLVGAISGLDVANESLDLAKRALKDNQTRVEVGTMAPIDI